MYVDEAAAVAEFKIRMTTTSLVLRRDPVGDNPEDYSVLKNGVVVGRIFLLGAVAPQDRPWMSASGHSGDIRRATTATSRRARLQWLRSPRAGAKARAPTHKSPGHVRFRAKRTLSPAWPQGRV
jgi:hypothetical protein